MQHTQPNVTALDHLVLTVADIASTTGFYENVLGMVPKEFQTADGEIRWALSFGNSKINLHQQGAEFEPKSARPTAGSADLCFLTTVPIENWIGHLSQMGVEIEEGPVARTGAKAPLTSIYIRDPDQNLIEIAVER